MLACTHRRGDCIAYPLLRVLGLGDPTTLHDLATLARAPPHQRLKASRSAASTIVCFEVCPPLAIVSLRGCGKRGSLASPTDAAHAIEAVAFKRGSGSGRAASLSLLSFPNCHCLGPARLDRQSISVFSRSLPVSYGEERSHSPCSIIHFTVAVLLFAL